jgi:hypothetical protein
MTVYLVEEHKMIEILSTQSDNVLAVAAHGTVSAEDYEKILIPAIERKLASHPKLRFLYQLGNDFTGFTPKAMWDDAKVGLRHLTAFEKIAVVSEVPWVVGAMKLFRPFVPCPVKIFGNDELAAANAWLTA